MKQLFFLLMFIPLCLHANPKIEEYENIPLKEWHAPKIERITLSNGLKVFLLEDKELPIVNGKFFIPAASVYEKQDKVGLASITAALLRQGGAGHWSSTELNAFLENKGIDIHLGANKEYSALGFMSLKTELDSCLDAVFAILQKPRFEEERLNLLKVRSIDALKRQNDDPSQIAAREFPKLIYGPDSPWSRTPTMKMVESFTVQDVKDFYQTYYLPKQMNLAISGNFDKNELIQKLEERMKDWNPEDKDLPKIPEVSKEFNPSRHFAQKKADQVTLYLGHWGARRSNPDKFALLLLNYILGGETLTSRLGVQIRSSQGLAYSIYSNFGFGQDLGLFQVVAQTKAQSSADVILEIKKIMQNLLVENSISEHDLKAAKEAFLNSLYASYEPKFNIVSEEARFNFLGYPDHYLEIFAKKISEVKLEDLSRVGKEYLHPDHLKILAVGDRAVAHILFSLGSWEEIELKLE